MQYARLGCTGGWVSRIGFGGWAIGGHGYGPVDDGESIRAIRRAVELGVTLFDTADVYGLGRAETILARALGRARANVVVATKGGVRWDDRGRTRRDISRASLTEALEGSLRRLGHEPIDLYHLHWPDGRTPIADAMETLAGAQRAGKIRHIGCCNCTWDVVREAHAVAPLTAVQMPYSLVDREAAPLIANCSASGMSTLVFGPLAHGVLSGKYDATSVFTEHDIRRRSPHLAPAAIARTLEVCRTLARIGRGVGRTASQVAIRWVLEHPAVTTVLTGVKTVGQIEENADEAWELPPDDVRTLDRLLASSRRETADRAGIGGV